MSTEENVQLVKNFFAAMGSSNARDLLALAAEDIEWIIPGEGWPLAGTHRGHAELAAVLKKASEEVETQYPKPLEFVAQGDRVVVVGVATGKIKATNRPFKDEWVFDISVRDGKVARIQSLDQIFRSARTPNGWADRPVEDDLVREIYDLMKWGPTSANSSPARFVWVRSPDGKATLAGLAAEPNKPKILRAPVTVIIGHDLDFADELP